MLEKILLIHHATRESAIECARLVQETCDELGVSVYSEVDLEKDKNLRVDLVIALGGDGTLLFAAEYGRQQGVPIIGFNTGHMGFLTEIEDDDIRRAISRLVARDFRLDVRQTIEVLITHPDGSVEQGWALNEASIMNSALDHPANFTLGVDGRGVSSYAADGVIIATPTGSTAYAYSAGGPIVWPDVESMLLVPLAAHGLFRTPIVVGANSVIQVKIDPDQPNPLEVWFDGQRKIPISAGCVVEARVSPNPIVLAALSEAPFSARLVSKFRLPVEGWKTGSRK